jgi:Prp8 binding protein
MLDFGLYGHTDTVTGMQLSASGEYLLTNGMDNTVRMWDVRPFVEPNTSRLKRVFLGGSHNFERNLLRCGFGYNDKLVTAGSADRVLYVWNAETSEIKHRLGGHHGSLNDAQVHPTKQIVASASSDKTILLGDLLQAGEQQSN